MLVNPGPSPMPAPMPTPAHVVRLPRRLERRKEFHWVDGFTSPETTCLLLRVSLGPWKLKGGAGEGQWSQAGVGVGAAGEGRVGGPQSPSAQPLAQC